MMYNIHIKTHIHLNERRLLYRAVEQGKDRFASPEDKSEKPDAETVKDKTDKRLSDAGQTARQFEQLLPNAQTEDKRLANGPEVEVYSLETEKGLARGVLAAYRRDRWEERSRNAEFWFDSNKDPVAFRENRTNILALINAKNVLQTLWKNSNASAGKLKDARENLETRMRQLEKEFTEEHLNKKILGIPDLTHTEDDLESDIARLARVTTLYESNPIDTAWEKEKNVRTATLQQVGSKNEFEIIFEGKVIATAKVDESVMWYSKGPDRPITLYGPDKKSIAGYICGLEPFARNGLHDALKAYQASLGPLQVDRRSIRPFDVSKNYGRRVSLSRSAYLELQQEKSVHPSQLSPPEEYIKGQRYENTTSLTYDTRTWKPPIVGEPGLGFNFIKTRFFLPPDVNGIRQISDGRFALCSNSKEVGSIVIREDNELYISVTVDGNTESYTIQRRQR